MTQPTRAALYFLPGLITGFIIAMGIALVWRA